jgi:hypothetical protein
MTQTNASPTDRAKARVATYATPQLVDALVIVDAAPASPENLIVRRWLISEAERRYPAASDAVEAAFTASELAAERTGELAAPVDYVAVLVANIPPSDLA